MIIDYKLTGQCNDTCAFCWDFCKGATEANTKDILAVFEKFIGIVDIVSLTGGEPLCAKSFDIVVRELCRMGFKLYLSTNGILFEKHFDAIIENISVLGLPIDSISCEIQSQMGRKSDSIKHNLNIINLVRRANPSLITKVGTVATKVNADTIEGIGDSIFSLEYPPNSWRVYQFTPYGYAQFVRDRFFLDDYSFNNLCEKLSKKFGSAFSFLPSNAVMNSYWFLTPDLFLAKLTDNSYVKVADAKTITSSNLKKLLSKEDIEQSSYMNRRHLHDILHD